MRKILNYKKYILLLFTAVFLIGAKNAVEERYLDLQTFAKVLNLIQQYYVEDVDTKKLIYGGIKGMLRELDPHTNFLPPDIFKEFENETTGEFGGIGIEISSIQGVLTIISPIEDTPAFIAGVKPGDKVIAIDGKSTKGLSLVEAAQLMRGKKGQKIVLTVARDSVDKPLDIPIVRGNVKMKSVKYTDMQDGYAYVRLTQFMETTSQDLKKSLDAHISKNKEMKGLIIDLRKNPGGLLDQAVKISDFFLDEGLIVSTIGKDKSQKEIIKANKEGTYPRFPIIILMNQYSASASEIVAGALQDNKRAIIMGERSFGKGSVQSVVKLGDGSALKLTIARYYTPSGISIQSEGIKPDIAVEDVDVEAFRKAIIKQESSREKDIAGHLKGDKEISETNPETGKTSVMAWWQEVAQNKKVDNLNPKEKLIKSDYQVYQAYNYLQSWRLMKNISL